MDNAELEKELVYLKAQLKNALDLSSVRLREWGLCNESLTLLKKELYAVLDKRNARIKELEEQVFFLKEDIVELNYLYHKEVALSRLREADCELNGGE